MVKLIPAIAISFWLMLSHAFAQVNDQKPDAHAFVKGMTISCPRDGSEWGDDPTVESMKTLKAMGVNWICIHPYAGIRNNGEVAQWRNLKLDPAPNWLTRPIREAHKLGLKILIKPHIGYWGSKFSWRGAIEFQSDVEWQRFFKSYEKWVIELAKASKEADAFAVGTELDKTLSYDKEWRSVIAGVRKEFKGPLTYAANWTDYKRVGFWDALDQIGIQAYFPILTKPSEVKSAPALSAIRQGWKELRTTLVNYSKKIGKKIVFTELGYNRSSDAPYKPWEYQTGGPEAELSQERCLQAALEVIQSEEAITGAFLWKWFPGDYNARKFAKSTPNMRSVIRNAWLSKKTKAKESKKKL